MDINFFSLDEGQLGCYMNHKKGKFNPESTRRKNIG